MMELEIASKAVPDEIGRTRYFHYFLLVDQAEADNFSCENYGVKISETDGDATLIRGITTDALRIDELITTLVDNLASPTILADVVADWL